MKKDYKRYVEKREDGVYMVKETLIETDTIRNFNKVEQRVTKQDVEDMIRDDKEQAFSHRLEQKQTLKQVQEVENRLKNLINKRDYIKFKQDINKHEFYNKIVSLKLNHNIFQKKIRLELEEFIKHKESLKQHFITYDDEKHLEELRQKLVAYNDIVEERALFINQAKEALKEFK